MLATLGAATITIAVSAPMANELDLGTGVAPAKISKTYTFTHGTGANQAGNVFADQRTTDGTGESLDLAGGLTNAFGETITFTAIKAIVIKASAANTIDVVVGGGGVNSFVNWVGDASDTIIIPPGGAFMHVDPGAAGFAVTPGTGDLLKIAAASTGSVTYDIILIGEV